MPQIRIYVSEWTEDVLTRIASEKRTTVEELVERLAENIAFDESNKAERAKRGVPS